MNKLTDKYIYSYNAMLDVNLDEAYAKIVQREWSVESFRFYTAVSVMSSSRIEGEQMEIDSYLKHKMQDVAYLPNLTEKPNDLFEAYEFARDNKLTLSNFYQAHSISTKHLLPEYLRGVVRTGNMIIMDQQSQRVQYEAASALIVKNELDDFWGELNELINQELSLNEIFYYASLIHLVFVKIHPFNDGNGRTARLLEKWFLNTKLGAKAWYIGSEHFYYKNLQNYYHNLASVGLFYEDLSYSQSIPFLLMLPNSLKYNDE
jgi:Fic family protein